MAAQERALAEQKRQLEESAEATAIMQHKQMAQIDARARELVALHESKMAMVAQAQENAKALAEAQERDYRDKVKFQLICT